MSSKSIALASSARGLRRAWIVALVIGLFQLAWAAPADAKNRIVVLEFEGPRGEDFRADVVKLVRKSSTIVSIDSWLDVADELGATKVTARNIKKIARRLNVDGVIVGEVEKRRDRFILRLKVREGVSGELIGNPIEVVSEASSLDDKATRNLRDELLETLELIGEGGGGGGGDDDDDDGDDRKGFGGGGRDNDRDDDDRGDRDDGDRDDDDGDDKDRAKAEKAAKAEREKAEKADREKAEKAAKADREKAEKAAKAEKAEREREKRDREKAEKAEKARARERDRDNDRDDDDDRDRDNARDDDDGDDDDDRRIGRRDDDDDGDGDDGDDDDRRDDGADDGDRDTSRWTLQNRGVEVAVGMGIGTRSLSFAHDEDLTSRPQGYGASPAAMLDLDAEIYPLAMKAGSRGITRNLGLSVSFARAPSLASELAYDMDGMVAIASLPTISQRWGFGVAFRHVLGAGPKAPVLTAKLRYNRLRFRVDRDAAPADVVVDIPNVHYGFVDPTLGLRYPLNAKMSISAEVVVPLMMTAGPIQDLTSYGPATITAFGTELAFDYAVSARVFARAALDFTTMGIKFKGQGALSTGRDTDDMQDVQSARDTYLGFTVAGGYVF